MPAKASEKPRKAKDEYNIHGRLEKLISDVFDEYEKNPELFAIKDKLSVIQYVGMWLTRNIKLQEATDEQHTGSAVAKYSGAFRVQAPTHAASVRKGGAGRSVPALVHDSDTGSDDPGDDSDAA